MDSDALRKSLEKLQAELARAPRVDAESRELLRRLSADIDRLVAQPGRRRSARPTGLGCRNSKPVSRPSIRRWRRRCANSSTRWERQACRSRPTLRQGIQIAKPGQPTARLGST